MKTFTNSKEWSTSQILNMAHSGATNTGSKWYHTLQVAKKQFGSNLEKIEMAMNYVTFKNEQEETECFNYLLNNI
jgi:hypothetical protein